MIAVQPSSTPLRAFSFEEREQPKNNPNLVTGPSSDPSPIQPFLSAKKSPPIVNQEAKKLSERPTPSQSKAPNIVSSSLSPRSILRRGNSSGLSIVIHKSSEPPKLMPPKSVEPRSLSAPPAK